MTSKSTSFLKLPYPDDQLDFLFSPEIKLNSWPSRISSRLHITEIISCLSYHHLNIIPPRHLTIYLSQTSSHHLIWVSIFHYLDIVPSHNIASSTPSQVITPHSHPPSSHSTAKALRGWATPSFPRRPSLPNIDFACFLCFWQTALPLSLPRPWVIIFGAQGYLNIWQIIQILRNLGHNNRIFGEIFGRLSRFQGHFGNTGLSISLNIW